MTGISRNKERKLLCEAEHKTVGTRIETVLSTCVHFELGLYYTQQHPVDILAEQGHSTILL